MRKIVLGFFIIILFFAAFNNVRAAGLVPCDLTGPNACTFCDFFVMLDNIIDFILFDIVPPVAVLMLAIGGGMYIIGLGNPNMLSRAKSLFTAVVIGLLIIYGAWIFVNTFFMLIGINEVHFQGLPQNWFKIDCP